MIKRITPAKLEERELRVIAERQNVTGKISETCRYVGFGMLAIYYSLRVGEGKLARIEADHYWAVFLVGVFHFFVILFDDIQFFFAEKLARATLKTPDFLYNDESCWYRARKLFFQLKQYTVILGVIVLAYLLFSI